MNNLDKNNKLTSFQVFTITVLNCFSSLSFIVSRKVNEKASFDGWISFILVTLIHCFGAFIIVSVARKFPNDTIFTFSTKLTGKILGTIINLSFILYSFGIIALKFRIYLDVTYSVAFRETPQMLVIFMFLIPVVYLVTKNELVLGRMTELSFFLFCFLILLNFALIHETNLDFLRPVGSNGITEILWGIIPASNAFISLFSIFLFFPHIENKNTALKNIINGITYSGIMLILSFICLVGLFGTDRVNMLVWPELTYLSEVRMPVFDRIDVITIVLWSFINSTSIFISFLFVKVGLKETFNTNYDSLVILISLVLSIYLIIFPKNYPHLVSINEILIILGIISNFLLPLILLIISLFAERRENN